MASVNTDTYKKVDNVAQDLKSKALDKMMTVEEQAEKFGLDAAKRVESFASSSFDMARDYAKSGRDYVKSNPAKGIAIAAAAGLVTGGLIAMIMRKKH